MAEEFRSKESAGLSDAMKDAIRKIVLTGVGTIFLTEEAVRNILGDLKLPKELWAGLLENAAKQKTEFFTLFAKEAANVLGRIDIADEVRKVISGQKLRINIELSIEKNEKPEKGEKAERVKRER